MSSPFLKALFVSPSILGIILLLATGVMAAPDKNSTQVNGIPASRVAANDTKAEADSRKIIGDEVKPGDWQYTALQGVASKYGCDANLNNKTVSTVDFARGLNNCLVKFEPMLANQPSSVTSEDLEVIKRLTQEFRAQLSEIDNRLNQSDKKIAQVQANQFSTTTKLKGEAIFNVTGAVAGADPNNTVFGKRVRLLFETSFSGKDRLWTRIAAGNQPGINANFKNGATAEGSQVSEGFTPGLGSGAVGVDWLAYQLPFNNSNIYIAGTGGLHVDYAPTYGGSLEDATGGNGALTNFAESSPIYKLGGGAGVGTSFPVSETTGLTSVTVGYLAGNANSGAKDKGLFNGDYAALAQANFKLSDKLDAGLTYVNSYHTAGNPLYAFGTGVGVTGTGTGGLTSLVGANANPGNTSANSYGAEFTFKASDTLAFNGFVLNTIANKTTLGKQDIWSYGGGVTLPNVDGKGGLIGLVVGAEPYVGGVGKTPFHIEGFYKYKLSDNLSITPGLIYLTAPNQIGENGAFVGVVRTTFTF
jgi:Carbohydrate-selective porin, OprB family